MQKLYFQEMKWKLFFSLVFTFIAFTIIGTQTHEYGHYAAAKYLGMQPSLHYQSVDNELSENEIELDKIHALYQKEIDTKKDFPAKKRFDELCRKETQNDIFTRSAGPLQTMLTGTIAFIILLANKKKYFSVSSLNWKQWLLIFCSLFWLRQVLNLVIAIVTLIITDRKEFYGDEFILAQHFRLPIFTIQIITAVIGFIICSIVTFKFVPSTQRKIFIAAGLVGGVIGYILWMHILGPILLP
jgi:hypothetical protein